MTTIRKINFKADNTLSKQSIQRLKTEYKLNDAELANLIIKQLKVQTTSNKSVVAFKLANAK